MGNKEHRDFKALLEHLHADAHLLAKFCVEIAERLVQEQHPRLGNERARKGDPLLLAAAQQRSRTLFEA
jgi:hypothetical protein